MRVCRFLQYCTANEANDQTPHPRAWACLRHIFVPKLPPSLDSSLSAFDEDCDVVDDYFGHEFEFLVVSSGGGEVVA